MRARDVTLSDTTYFILLSLSTLTNLWSPSPLIFTVSFLFCFITLEFGRQGRTKKRREQQRKECENSTLGHCSPIWKWSTMKEYPKKKLSIVLGNPVAVKRRWRVGNSLYKVPFSRNSSWIKLPIFRLTSTFSVLSCLVQYFIHHKHIGCAYTFVLWPLSYQKPSWVSPPCVLLRRSSGVMFLREALHFLNICGGTTTYKTLCFVMWKIPRGRRSDLGLWGACQ